MSSPIDRLECTLDRWVSGRPVLRFSDGQELIINKRHLPKDSHDGSKFELHFHTEASASQGREELARAILKEILSG